MSVLRLLCLPRLSFLKTNLGELEQTLHREFIMAANLRDLLDRQSFTDTLAPFSHIVGEFLRTRYPGSERANPGTWKASHNGRAVALDTLTFDALRGWAGTNNIRPFTRHLFICTKLR